MEFKQHSELKDKHSYLSASKPAWLRDDPEDLIERVRKSNAAAVGTRKHNLAAELIALGQKLPASNQTLCLYVNDAIGYRMHPEQALFYSWYAFGTADAISFRREADGTRVLRIFDLKTGVGPTKFEQLIIYAAYFCLEYGIKPFEIEYDLRIYQNDAVRMYEPTGEEVLYCMTRIVESDEIIRNHIESEA